MKSSMTIVFSSWALTKYQLAFSEPPCPSPTLQKASSLYTPPYNRSLDTVIDETTAALADQEFGVLNTIDIQATMKAKLDKDERPYVILGACHPQIAHQALSFLPSISALLPCNVLISENDDQSISVSIIDPMSLFSILSREDMDPIVLDVKSRLSVVLETLHN